MKINQVFIIILILTSFLFSQENIIIAESVHNEKTEKICVIPTLLDEKTEKTMFTPVLLDGKTEKAEYKPLIANIDETDNENTEIIQADANIKSNNLKKTTSFPDLEPYKRSDWDDKIVLSNTTGSTITSATIYDDQTIYVDFACVNSGDADAGAFKYGLYVDGILTKYVSKTSMYAGYYSYVLDSSIGTLSAGSHKFEIIVDFEGTVSESNEGNNIYTRYFTIMARTVSKPDLEPYKTGDWDDKIVLSSTTGSTITSSTIYDDQTIYVDFACVNSGDADAGAFKYGFYIDGALNKYVSLTSLNAGYYSYVLDADIGTLSAGTHTFEIRVDFEGTVSESNESNNVYTRYFTIQARSVNKPDLEPYKRSDWDNKIVLSNTTGTTTTGSSIYNDQTIYVDFSCANNGNTDAGAFKYGFYIDGVLDKYVSLTSLSAGYHSYVLDADIGTLNAGSHTFEIRVDYEGVVSEANESNNIYTRYFTILERASSKPDLEPFKRNDWDDKIVLSNTTGTTITSSSIYDDQTIYADFSCINSGDADAGAFKYGLYVDGTLKKYVSKTSMSAGYYSYVLDSDIGTLSAGSHKIEIIVDFEGAVSEANESNNTYTRFITILGRTSSADINVSPQNIIIREEDSNSSSRYFSDCNTELTEIPIHSLNRNIPDVKHAYINSFNDTICVNSIKGRPPESYDKNAALSESAIQSGTIVPYVPAYNWSFGCSPTSAAMLIGYYDNFASFANLYTGPSNNGLAPMDNSIWPDVMISGERRHQCPISASRNGLDERTLRGNVDSYWIAVNNNDSDPYIIYSWTEHEYGDCVADYMGTSQSRYGNVDGETRFWNYTNGAPMYDANLSAKSNDGCHGIRLFFEARGYNVVDNFNQLIYGYDGNSQGFTFNQFKQEIDNGNPILIHVQGHTMLAVGYDDSQNRMLFRNTWDYNTYSMPWGGIYEGMQHYSVSVIHIDGNSIENTIAILNSGGQKLRVSSIYNNASNWLNIDCKSTPFEIDPGEVENMNLSVTNWSAVSRPQSIGEITINSNDPDESSFVIRITAIPQNSSSIQGIIHDFVLEDNYPNPFNPVTTISFEISEDDDIELAILDVNGKTIETLLNEYKSAGRYEVSWDASSFSSGIYFYRLKAGDIIETKKLILLK